MVIPKCIIRRLASIVVIIALILPKTAAQVVSHNGSVANNVSARIKQQDKTIRVDPLDNFRKYRGGFHITNKHYWGSVFFTGVYGYAIGVLWLLCGIVCGVFLVTNIFCCQNGRGRRTREVLPHTYKSCHLSSIPLAILFMILTMVASVVVYVGSVKFHSQARTSVNIIINIADDTSEIIYNATRALQDIKEDLVASSFISEEASGKLNSTAKKFDNVVDNIRKETRKNRRLVNKALKAVFITTIVIISLNLVAVPILSVFGVKMFWRPFYLFVILCWLMTVICWLIFGLYIFLENFNNDTCTVLHTFEANPYNNSLTSILPCDELGSAKSILHEMGSGFSIIVNEVNSNLESMFPDNVSLCNPFSAAPEYSYQPEHCPPNSIQIGDIPKVLKPYTCFDGSDEKCDSDDFLNGGEYKVVESYASSVQNLLNIYPSVDHLIGCELVKDAFSLVLLKHCKPLKKFARMTWVGLVILAVIMVFFVVLWIIKSCREHSYHPSDCPV